MPKKLVVFYIFFVIWMAIQDAGMVIAQTDVKSPPILSRQLFVGLRGNDVKILQEYLAQDKDVYPEGLVTGYFGSLTRNAIQRFQCKHNIICSGDEVSTGYGRIGPKTIAKLKELAQKIEAEIVAPPPAPESTPTPTPTPQTEPAPTSAPIPEPTLETPATKPAIKTGSGTVSVNKYFDIGTGTLYYTAVSPTDNRAYIAAGEPAIYIADITRSEYSSCENISDKSYRGVADICQFTDAAKHQFTELKESLRVYDKNASYRGSSCYYGIMLFKQNNLYGGLEFKDIDTNGILNYRYWYDESGETNFNTLCNTSSQSEKNVQTASLWTLIKSAIQRLFGL